MEKFKGIFTALVTPFHQGQIDFDSLEKLLEFQIKNGVQGFVVSGTTGESPTLSLAEKEEIFKFIKKRNPKIPIIVGTGTNATQATIDTSKRAEEWGADALLVVVPYYNKPPQRGLIEHFQSVARAVDIPVILYNVPSRTVTGLTEESIEEVSKIPNIIGIKEATGDIQFAKMIMSRVSQPFLLSSGDDGTWLNLYAVGGSGVISVLSHVIPDVMMVLQRQILSGDLSALESFKDYHELVRLLFIEANPIPVKYALHRMGILKSNELRLPLVPLAREFHQKIDSELRRLEVIK